MATQTCFDFSVGKCSRDNCKFEHAEVHIPTGRKPDRGDREDRGRDDRRRRDAPRDFSSRGGQSDRCYDFTVGKCDRGSSCKFAHPETCYDFSIGKCTRDACKFFHAEVHTRATTGRGGFQTSGYGPDRAPHRSTRGSDRTGRGDRGDRRRDDASLIRSHKRGGAESGDVCYDFTIADCNRGTACKFVHPETCFDASIGKCDRGERCRFLHPGPHNRRQGKRDAGAPVGRRGEDKTRACYDFTQNRCTRGDACKFSHGDPVDAAAGEVLEEQPLDDELLQEQPFDITEEVPAEPLVETCYDFSVNKCNRGDGCRFVHDPDRKHVPTNKRAAPY